MIGLMVAGKSDWQKEHHEEVCGQICAYDPECHGFEFANDFKTDNTAVSNGSCELWMVKPAETSDSQAFHCHTKKDGVVFKEDHMVVMTATYEFESTANFSLMNESSVKTQLENHFSTYTNDNIHIKICTAPVEKGGDVTHHSLKVHMYNNHTAGRLQIRKMTRFFAPRQLDVNVALPVNTAGGAFKLAMNLATDPTPVHPELGREIGFVNAEPNCVSGEREVYPNFEGSIVEDDSIESQESGNEADGAPVSRACAAAVVLSAFMLFA